MGQAERGRQVYNRFWLGRLLKIFISRPYGCSRYKDRFEQPSAYWRRMLTLGSLDFELQVRGTLQATRTYQSSPSSYQAVAPRITAGEATLQGSTLNTTTRTRPLQAKSCYKTPSLALDHYHCPGRARPVSVRLSGLPAAPFGSNHTSSTPPFSARPEGRSRPIRGSSPVQKPAP